MKNAVRASSSSGCRAAMLMLSLACAGAVLLVIHQFTMSITFVLVNTDVAKTKTGLINVPCNVVSTNSMNEAVPPSPLTTDAFAEGDDGMVAPGLDGGARNRPGHAGCAGKGANILVTGVAGYIGSHMALNLLEKGVKVLGIDNMSRGSLQSLKVLKEFPNFQFELIDLGDTNAVDLLFQTHRRVNTVLHFAAVTFVAESVQNPLLYMHNITQNTMILVDAMLRHNVEKLLFSSTCAVYGNPKELPITEHAPTAPMSPYGQSKLDAEEYIRSKASASFKAHFLRYFNVIGADSSGRLVENPRPENDKYARLWTACMDVVFGRRQCVHVAHDGTISSPDGSEIRHYVHIEDVVKANSHLMERNFKENIEVWNVAASQPMSTLEFIETARRVTGVFIQICFVDASKESSRKSSSPPVLFASAAKLRQETGWSATYDAMEDILATAWRSTVRHTNVSSTIAGSDMMGIWSSMPRHPWDWTSEEYDVCIVGAGLSAAVLAERHASQLNHSVLVIEKRNHIGGNCFDYVDKETGIRVSKYGIHLFHTKFDRVWEYLNRFSRWTRWEHRALAKVDDLHVPVPVNIDTVNAMFGLSISTSVQMEKWLKGVQIKPPNGTAKNSEEIALQRVGQTLYSKIFKPYTIKQWNKDPRDLDPSVMARIPVRSNKEDRYFTDLHQALPTDGYTRIFENMFNHPKINVKLNTDFFNFRKSMKCKNIYYTGPIDDYFASSGMEKLEYRSLRFDRRVYQDTDFYQPTAHVNYPSLKYNFTRVIEYKHVLNQSSPHTVVFFEYSSDVGEPYYPVPNERNQALYAKYQKLAERQSTVTFVGGLANYKYFNMDETVLNALTLFDKNLPEVNFEKPCSLGLLVNGYLWDSAPLKKLLASLKGSPFLTLVVTHGNRTELTKVSDQVYNLRIQHNNFDFTALVAVAEHQGLLKQANILKKNWFYTHETTSVGSNFTRSMVKLCPTFTLSRPLTRYPSMNIGLYSNKDIVDNLEFILTQKSHLFAPTRQDLNYLKGLGVKTEDSLFKRIKVGAPLSSGVGVGEPHDVYETGTKRIVEYYPAVDFYKYKANWGWKSNWALDP